MTRRTLRLTRRQAVASLLIAMTPPTATADASGAELASYYDRHMALRDGVAWAWAGRGEARVAARGVRQVGVGRRHWYTLLDDGRLQRRADLADEPTVLMRGLRRFASGESGWFGIDAAGVLWHGRDGQAPQAVTEPVVERIAEDVVDACIGDGADYYVTRDGRLWVKGLAHRGQYGDGKLAASDRFVATATDAVAVRAHTGHALHLRRDGVVMGTGGNRYGPLSSHGLGDKADRWGRLFDGAVAIATGSRHSAALRADGSLWVWGEGFGIEPRKLRDGVRAVAAGDTATIALTVEGEVWQWEGGGAPSKVLLGPR